MAELADAPDLGSGGATRASSILVSCTKKDNIYYIIFFYFGTFVFLKYLNKY